MQTQWRRCGERLAIITTRFRTHLSSLLQLKASTLGRAHMAGLTVRINLHAAAAAPATTSTAAAAAAATTADADADASVTRVQCVYAVDMMMTGGQGCQQPGPNIPNSSWPGKDGPVPIPSMNPDKPCHDPGSSEPEYRTEGATYAISASPMMIGTDIR